LAFYGPFPSQSRVRDYNRVWVLEAKNGLCTPCFMHGAQPCPLAAAVLGFASPCLAAITPGQVYEALSHIFTVLGFDGVGALMRKALIRFHDSLVKGGTT